MFSGVMGHVGHIGVDIILIIGLTVSYSCIF